MKDELAKVRAKIDGYMNKQDKPVFGYYGKRTYHTDNRAEGEEWEDAEGTKWTKKDGVVQNVTKLQSAKTPWFCPQCEKMMSNKLDTKFWRLRNKCMDCVIKEETEMRRLGTYEAYEREHMKRNYMAYLRDTIQELEGMYDTVSAPEVIHADDTNILMVEKWDVDLDKVRADIQAELDSCRDLLHKIETGEVDYED